MTDIPLDPTSNRESLDLSGLFSKQWLNGQLLESPENLSIFDRSSQFGDGVFETILIHQGQCPLIERHIARLTLGLETLGIPLDQAVLIADIMQALEFAMQQASQSFRLKLRVTRGVSNSGYYSTNTSAEQTTRLIELSPLSYEHRTLQQGVVARICDWKLSDQPQLVNVKHLNRLDQVMARREWGAYKNKGDVFEGLMLDQRGFITEGVMSNLFWVDSDDKLHTPILDHSGVAGVMRSEIIAQAKTVLGTEVVESRLQLEDLPRIKALVFTNALIGIVPVTQLVNQQGQSVVEFTGHAIQDQLISAINHVLNIHI